MCADGWAGIGWPEEYGGQGRSAIEQFVFFDESMRAGAPVPMLTINTVAPTIMRFGSDEQKQFFLPKILAGDIHFCIGYSEPGAGTDLASLTTRAVRDGDEYVINGQKMWTSLAADADYCWLAVRTNPEVKKHQGISLIILPMDTPGITVSPLDLLVDHDINQVFFDDVRVPVDNCVGGENNGWTLITNQLNHERVTLCASGTPERALAEVRGWAQDTKLPDGRRVIDLEWVRLNLARVHANVEVLRLMNWQVAWEATEGVLDIGHCSSVKVFGTESNLESWRLLMEVLGAVAYLKPDAPGAVLRSRLEAHVPRHAHPHLRRRHQRVAARPDLAVLARPAAGEPLRWTSRSPPTRSSCRSSRAGSSPTAPRHERVKAVLATEHAVDHELWRTMADAGLVGISLPEAVGGGGLGFLETCIVLEEVGRAAAPVPALAVMGLGGTALAHFGGVEHLEGVADGTRIVTAALRRAGRRRVRPGDHGRRRRPAHRREGVRARGHRRGADRRHRRRRPLRGRSRVRRRRPSSARTPPAASPRRGSSCSGAPAERLAGPEGVTWLVEHAQAAMCVMAAGACAAALELTANVHEEPRAVRPADRDVPGGQPARRRRLHRHRGGAAHRVAGGVAARHRPARGGAGRDRQVLGERGRAARRARRPPPPRRDGRRPRLPAVPLLPAGQAARAVARLGDAVAGAPRRCSWRTRRSH